MPNTRSAAACRAYQEWPELPLQHPPLQRAVQQHGSVLTLAFVVDAALRLCLELGPNVVEQLVEALGWADLGAPHDAGRRVAVVHGDDLRHVLRGRNGEAVGMGILRATGGRPADSDGDGGVDACAGARLARLGSVAQLQASAQWTTTEAEPARGWARQVRDGRVVGGGLRGEVTMGEGARCGWVVVRLSNARERGLLWSGGRYVGRGGHGPWMHVMASVLALVGRRTAGEDQRFSKHHHTARGGCGR